MKMPRLVHSETVLLGSGSVYPTASQGGAYSQAVSPFDDEPSVVVLPMLNLIQVGYDSPYAAEAVAYRRFEDVGPGANVATFALHHAATGDLRYINQRSWRAGSCLTNAHSEELCFSASWDLLQQGYRIAWVYTEREPCGGGPGRRNCSAGLDEALGTWGGNGADTPVYYTEDYS